MSVKAQKSTVAKARRIHLFPCRTQKLSFLTPKVVGGQLPARHGRALLNLDDADQKRVLAEIEAKGLNVKQTEEIAKDVDAYFNPQPKKKEKAEQKRVVNRIPKDLKVQINTIKKAVKLAKDSGIKVKIKEDKNPDDYKITIELKRK